MWQKINAHIVFEDIVNISLGQCPNSSAHLISYIIAFNQNSCREKENEEKRKRKTGRVIILGLIESRKLLFDPMDIALMKKKQNTQLLSPYVTPIFPIRPRSFRWLLYN